MSSPGRVLPDYKNPPVTEIIAAAQFAPVPLSGIEHIVALGREFADWKVIEAPPAIPPMSEGPAGQELPQAFLAFGNPPVRVLLATDDGRWVAQFQQDRVAVHERKISERPSFRNVAPQLSEVAGRVSQALGVELFSDDHWPDMVEVIYENRIAAADGGWTNFGDLYRVLRLLNEGAGDAPYDTVEQVAVGFSYALREGEALAGRLRVAADPQYDSDGGAVLGLRLVSRRFVGDAGLERVMAACHADIVSAFTAITTPHMHEQWERYR
jgi:hypothetical protein